MGLHAGARIDGKPDGNHHANASLPGGWVGRSSSLERPDGFEPEISVAAKNEIGAFTDIEPIQRGYTGSRRLDYVFIFGSAKGSLSGDGVHRPCSEIVSSRSESCGIRFTLASRQSSSRAHTDVG